MRWSTGSGGLCARGKLRVPREPVFVMAFPGRDVKTFLPVRCRSLIATIVSISSFVISGMGMEFGAEGCRTSFQFSPDGRCARGIDPVLPQRKPRRPCGWRATCPPLIGQVIVKLSSPHTNHPAPDGCQKWRVVLSAPLFSSRR
jgi:hypothetical protein